MKFSFFLSTSILVIGLSAAEQRKIVPCAVDVLNFHGKINTVIEGNKSRWGKLQRWIDEIDTSSTIKFQSEIYKDLITADDRYTYIMDGVKGICNYNELHFDNYHVSPEGYRRNSGGGYLSDMIKNFLNDLPKIEINIDKTKTTLPHVFDKFVDHLNNLKSSAKYKNEEKKYKLLVNDLNKYLQWIEQAKKYLGKLLDDLDKEFFDYKEIFKSRKYLVDDSQKVSTKKVAAQIRKDIDIAIERIRDESCEFGKND